MNLKEHRRRVLGKLNFKERKGTKHERWVLEDADTGRLCVTTHVSRSNRDIGEGLMRAICAQLHVSKSQYHQIATCTMSKEAYYKHLIETDIA